MCICLCVGFCVQQESIENVAGELTFMGRIQLAYVK